MTGERVSKVMLLLPPPPSSAPTFTLEALSHQPPQHLPTLVTEGWSFVGVHVQHVRADLEVFGRSQSWRQQA